MKSIRRPIKETLDNKRRWREKFRQECTNQIKLARQEKIDKIRRDQLMHKILEEEWLRFKQENEQAMREEGIVDFDNLIDESIQEYEKEENEAYFQQEQEELESILASYEVSKNLVICVNCQKASLTPDGRKRGVDPIASCPNCGFYTTESCLHDIIAATSAHAANCKGIISYSLEPGTDDTIISICNICDLWNMFYL